jgi:hypothetical protein
VHHLITDNEENESSNLGQNLEDHRKSNPILGEEPFDPLFFKKDLRGTKSKDIDGSSNSSFRYPLVIFFYVNYFWPIGPQLIALNKEHF